LNVAATTTAQPSASPTAPTSGNLLDFMSDAADAAASAAAGEAKPSSAFGFMNSSESSSDVKQTSNMFDSLSLKGSDSAAGDAANKSAMSPPTSSGSAFGFMNTSNSDSVEKKADTPVAAAVSGMDSFDPLKHTTPNSPKKLMQMSPEQMQAMMYQQMMMQQQMQMAQMQMALQQQAKRGSAGGPQMFMSMPGRVMQNPAASKSTFAFMDKPQKPDDHSFDFVKDAMKNENKK
jgi:hypothetical protein